MKTPVDRPCRALLAAAALGLALSAGATDIGQIKVAKGQVSVERGGQTLPGDVGTRLQAADVLKTGADGSVGITMSDNSLLSAGPNSILALDRYALRPDDEPGPVRRVAAEGIACRDLGPHRQAIAGRDEGAHAVVDPRRARHRVRRQRR